jgi:glycosyltransferase involved in cell wall biosynthesis
MSPSPPSTRNFLSPNRHPAPGEEAAADGRPAFVSIVIPVLNGERTLRSCLAAVLAMDYPAERREVIVVDNGSTDATQAIVRSNPVTYLHEPRRGPATARNAGITAATGDVVAFTDADCLPTTEWLRELVKPLGSDDVGGVAGEILPFPPTTGPERYAARIRHLSPRRYLIRPIFPFAVTANLAFRREVFDQVGLLDTEAPRGGESTDFCTRFFRATGQRLEMAPRAVVFHRHRSTTRDFFAQHWGYGRGHAYLYEKYRDELPWGWNEVARTYRDLAATLGGLAGAFARSRLGATKGEELEFRYYDALRKVALRLGFAHESLARGRLML